MPGLAAEAQLLRELSQPLLSGLVTVLQRPTDSEAPAGPDAPDAATKAH